MGENNIFLSNDVFYCLEIKLDLITFDKSSWDTNVSLCLVLQILR